MGDSRGGKKKQQRLKFNINGKWCLRKKMGGVKKKPFGGENFGFVDEREIRFDKSFCNSF